MYVFVWVTLSKTHSGKSRRLEFHIDTSRTKRLSFAQSGRVNGCELLQSTLSCAVSYFNPIEIPYMCFQPAKPFFFDCRFQILNSNS
jgi:hypothetical protein